MNEGLIRDSSLRPVSNTSLQNWTNQIRAHLGKLLKQVDLKGKQVTFSHSETDLSPGLFNEVNEDFKTENQAAVN